MPNQNKYTPMIFYIPKNKKGSMLLNLIVSIGIMLVITTLGMPYFRKYQPNLILNAAARTLTTDIRYAQQMTVTEQIVYKVKFFSISDNYQILKIDAATTTVKSVTLDPEVSLKQITGLSDNEITFNYYGGVKESGQITLTNTNNLDAVINIKPSGYIELKQ